MTLVTPGVRFAIDTYINFARRAPWAEAVCASLSELACVDYWKTLLDTLNRHYQPVGSKTAEFFTARASGARHDCDAALQTVVDYFKSRDDQEYALDILQFKHDILWTCLDSISLSPVGQADSSPPLMPHPVKGESPKRSPRKKKSAPTPATEQAPGKNRAQNPLQSEAGAPGSSKGNTSDGSGSAKKSRSSANGKTESAKPGAGAESGVGDH
jgi:hypothetical protein